jgi:hypothetical protein
MGTIYHTVMRLVGNFGPQEWLLALLGVLLVGSICLRGFGSRSQF